MKTLSVDSVCFSYRHRNEHVSVLNGVSFTLHAGHLYAITGPSGSGKTTLLSLLAGITAPQSGRILLDGVPLNTLDLPEYRRSVVATIPQDFSLLPQLTALENIALPLRIRHMNAKRSLQKAQQAMQHVCLSGSLGKKLPAKLSGGEQQRVAIARAIAAESRLLLADEPTGNLDEQNRDEILHLMHSFSRQPDRCAVLVTHDPQVTAFADVCFRMENGIIQPVSCNA